MTRTLRFFLSLGLLSLPLSCSFTNGDNVGGRFVVDKNIPRSPGPNRAQFVGYIVNVSGPGISPTVSAQSIGSFAPSCADVGVSSLIVSYAKLSTVGIKLRIPAGPNRKIEVLGVTTSYGTEVLDQPVTVLFNNRVPQLYSLSKVTGVDLFKDSSLVLTGDANPVNPVNILENCTPVAKGSDGFDPATISALRIVTFSTESTSEVQNVLFDQNTNGLSAIGQPIGLGNSQDNMLLSPDATSLLTWSGATGLNKTFFMDATGTLLDKGAGVTTSFVSAIGGTFGQISDQGSFAYLGGNNFIKFLRRANGIYDITPPGGATMNSGTQLVTHGNYLYRISLSSAQVLIEKAQIPAEGTFNGSLTLEATGNLADPTFSQPTAHSLASSRGLYLLYTQASQLKLAFLAYASLGGLQAVGDPMSLNSSINTNQAKLVASPDGKFLFVYIPGSSTSLIATLRLNSDGSLPMVSTSGLSVTDFKDMAVDPFSKNVAAVFSNGSTSELRNYPIGANGTLSAPTFLSLGLSKYLSHVTFMPVF